MIVTFWGVRGSMPSPGRDTVRYGGNTACVSIESGNDILIIDSGTGIRELGQHLEGTDKRIFIAQSHLHYDHTLGFPLFAPLFEEGRPIYLIGFPSDGGTWTPLELMDGVFWPVTPADLPADLRIVGDEGYDMLSSEGLRVDRIPLNHPGGAFGFRFSDGNGTFLHMTDNELYPPSEPTTSFEELAAFCQGAEVLCHDAQYLEKEMPMKEGWGHSLAATACRLAIEADVGCLVLFHHDPDRSDSALDRMRVLSDDLLSPHNIKSIVAHEGLVLEIDRGRFFASSRLDRKVISP